MKMENEKKFRTKTGFCHIFPDKILLTRDGVVGDLAKITVGNSIARSLIIYGLIAMCLLYFAYKSFIDNQIFSAALFGIISIYLIFGIITSLNNSATPMIKRRDIKWIKFNRGIIGLTRSRFVVFFEDANGKMKKRLIMLPGSLTGGPKETPIALKIMEEAGLINIR